MYDKRSSCRLCNLYCNDGTKKIVIAIGGQKGRFFKGISGTTACMK